MWKTMAGVIIAGVLTIIHAAPAAAQTANRTFVSGRGVDTNPCSITSPCRSFAQAITQTTAGGEISVLDSAGYGTLTINKAISIFAPDGVEASIAATGAGSSGIDVNAGATDVVNLRGLTLTGLGGARGISFSGGAQLNVDHCAIGGFSIAGIDMSARTKLSVTDTTVSNDSDGFLLHPSVPGGASVTLARVHATSNSNAGIDADLFSNSLVFVADSLIDYNNIAIKASTGGANSGSAVMVDNSKLVQNPGGLNLSGFGGGGSTSTFTLARTTLFGAAPITGNYVTLGNNQSSSTLF
jgi:hypothetical protein